MNYIRYAYAFLLVLLISCGPEIPDEVKKAYNDLPEELDFNLHVKPILSDKCFLCHGPDKAKQQAGLRLDLSETAYGELPENPGKVAIKPGNLNKSQLFHRITSEDPEVLMPTPKSNLTLTDYEKAVLIKWIEDGAEYKPHWAFIKPEDRKPPKTAGPWVINDIDRFVLEKLNQEELKPSAEADKAMLLRRLSFDLTGLPPTLEEIDQFVNDNSCDAYEKQVDRLIASVHFGEKMTMDWVDLARYADTYGYQVDSYRDASPWRDWVIDAFNENMSYDQFVTWQLAGDLLPNPTKEQMIATGFNRLHPQNMEGGIVDEEFRVEYVADRTNVVGTGFMALTVGCAKCHDHKYDPISQKEYYQMFSFFNNVNETGQISWDSRDLPVPTMLLPTEDQENVITYLTELVEKSERKADETKEKALTGFENWLVSGGHTLLKPSVPTKGLEAHFKLDGTLKNSARPREVARMDRQYSKKEYPVYAVGYKSKGLKMDGDAWLDTDTIGVFKREQPFSIGLWINVPRNLKEGVIFHKNTGTRLYSYKGYHLNIRDNRLEGMLAHTWPDNAIVNLSVEEIPKEEWVHVMMTYDGSSRASGLKLYLNGKVFKSVIEFDNLYKDIVFQKPEGNPFDKEKEPGLQIGARWRGKGIGGAIVDELVVYDRELSPVEVMMIGNPDELVKLSESTAKALTSQQKNWLSEYYLKTLSRDYQLSLRDIEKSRRALVDSTELIKEIMVTKEMTVPRQTYVLERGLYNNYGEEVFPKTPEQILPMDEKYPRNRLGLAQWLFDEDHPLTARVAVNRYWQNYFGRGLVATTEDFGNQGDAPSHPELLDWLAIRFMESGWDVKALQKMIVMSATYRQSSIIAPELREKDPQNIYLARGPKMRLSSEMIRDNALAASGLLNREVGGESIKPYQPEGLWSMNSGSYEQSKGDDLYRRSMYVYWKRTVPHPTLSTFDQPERIECTVRRQKTNTPLQALVLLNDPAFVEASKVIGETITRSEDAVRSIKEAYQRITGIQPRAKELELLLKLQGEEYDKFFADPKRTEGWISVGEYEIDSSLDQPLVAANAVVASVILNSDASITKR